MGNRDMRDASLGDWLRRLPQYLYVADLIAGKRVLEVGCGTGAGAKFLADHGAARVVGIDASASTVGRARRVYHRGNLSFRHEDPADTELGDSTFDCVFVPDGMTVIKRPAVLRELRRVLAPDGYLVVSAPSTDRSTRAEGLSYHDIRDALSSVFAPVRMVAQTPFVAMSLVEYGDVDEGDVVLDTSLVEWSRTTSDEVVDYLAICGGRSDAARGFTVVQLPTKTGADVVSRTVNGLGETAGGRPAAPVSTQIGEALNAHAQLTRELERALAEQKAYNDELREELEQTLERADTAERARKRLAGKLAGVQEELKTWRSRASIAEGEVLRGQLARGEAGEAGEPAAGSPEGKAAAAKVEGGEAQGEELAELRQKLERVTQNWREAEAKNDTVWRRVGELQNELEHHREQAVARSAQARRAAQLSMAKAMEGASAKLVGIQDQLLRCEKRCEGLEGELREVQRARDELQGQLEGMAVDRTELERRLYAAEAGSNGVAVRPRANIPDVDDDSGPSNGGDSQHNDGDNDGD